MDLKISNVSFGKFRDFNEIRNTLKEKFIADTYFEALSYAKIIHKNSPRYKLYIQNNHIIDANKHKLPVQHDALFTNLCNIAKFFNDKSKKK